jgi:spore germination protein GerM
VTTRRASVAASGLALALLVVACGIPVDNSPRVLARKDLPGALVDGTPTTITSNSGAMVELPIYLIRNVGPAQGTQVMTSRRVPVPVANSLVSQAEAVLRTLIAFQPSSYKATAGLNNDIPSNLRILSASLDGNILELDLSQIDSSVQSTLLRLAFAQMVFTATDLIGIDRVRFSIAGQPTQVLLDSGTSKAGEAIGRGDYHQLSG